MADLTKILSLTTTAIDKIYEARNKPRVRLGLSEIGSSCLRRLWYKHHGRPGKQPDGRVLRLFELGNILEDQTIADLTKIGVLVTGQQREVVFTLGDVTLTGHIDGVVSGLLEAPATPHLFEHKTASRKKYNELIKKGSYRAWNEVYYWQVQAYMLGMNLDRAVVFVYCKDDSRLYMERIKLDEEATVLKLETVFAAIAARTPPERACPSAAWYEAKWCPHYNECFDIPEAEDGKS